MEVLVREKSREAVLKVLREAEDWMTISEISRRAGVAWTTAKYTLLNLLAEGVVEVRKLGYYNLFRLKSD